MKLIALCFCLALSAPGQVRPAATSDSPLTNLPAHRIGPNDLLSVSVYDAPEFSKSVRVSPEGNIRLPMVKSAIAVAGALPLEVESSIAEALRAEEILVDPFVTVTIAEYSSRPIIVAGAVKQPQTFQAVGPMRLLDAIGKAGGLTDRAGSEILVSAPGVEPRRVPVKGLLESADPTLNATLVGGEEIRVAEAGRAFVVGNVRKPGAFMLRDAEDSTVLQMLALAEGLTPFSSKQAFIYRRQADGSRREIPVEIERILRRKSADVSVLADDILYIPENKGRKLSIAALERVLSFGSTAGATALIYGSR